MHGIQAAVERSGLSQNEVARRAGMDPKSLSEIARGLRDPRISTALRIAAVLESTLDELFPPQRAA